ncbi:MAG: hypothetical protein EOM53_04690 [Alphaproteobacteria bacterium]|nr:hypothetical protein [Alphaproteobacteria bacterium]NCB49954.1 hypothetical protein [Alphaproteobacteria bacterium]
MFKSKQFSKNMFILVLWSWIYLYWLRFFLYRNWYFDFAWADDWGYVWNEWLSGWIIHSVSDWTFIFTIFSAVPFWLIGYSLLISLDWSLLWEKGPKKLFFWFSGAKDKKILPQKPTFAKKPSHLKVRPPALQIGEARAIKEPKTPPPQAEEAFEPSFGKRISAPRREVEETEPYSFIDKDIEKSFNKSSFDDFLKKETKEQPLPVPETPLASLDEDIFPKPTLREPPAVEIKEEIQNKQDILEDIESHLKEKKYTVLLDILFDGYRLDFIALSQEKLVLGKLDSEKGDWLADEEQFNDDDPLWFSESSHRISPIFEIQKIKATLSQKLKENGIKMDVASLLVIYKGDIINVEDMEETWKDSEVAVVRTNEKASEDLPFFKDAFADTVSPIDEAKRDQLEKILRG